MHDVFEASYFIVDHEFMSNYLLRLITDMRNILLILYTNLEINNVLSKPRTMCELLLIGVALFISNPRAMCELMQI